MHLFLALIAVACTPTGEPADSTTTGDSDTLNETAPPDDTQAPSDLPAVVANELMAANDSAVESDNGDYPDWFELYNAGDTSVDLTGHFLSDDWTNKDKGSIADGTSIEPGGFLLFWADNSLEEGHVPFKLDSQGECVGLFDGEGNAVNWVCYTTQREDHSWARLPDGSEDWDEVARGTPGSTNLRLEEQSTVLVEKGATWSYLDSGEYPGDDWTTEGFDDDTWASGTAPLGYGDSQTTQVSYGDNSSDKHPTTWFRLGFSMEGDLLERSDGMDLDLRVDDGCVVWINGEELMRQAMPDGDISADSYASATASGDGETSYAGYSYGTDRLVAGANVVAVEVHQANATSSDITIDLQLSLETWVEVE